MSPITTTSVIARIDQLLADPLPAGDAKGIHIKVTEALQATLTLVSAIYGDNSMHADTLKKALANANSKPTNISHNFYHYVWPAVQGTLRAMKADVEAGLIGDLERRVAGEVLADMLGLAKEALSDGRTETQNVAAVLTAAAFEDTIRKMGSTLAGVTDRPKLENVLTTLKSAGVIVGAPLSTAQSYLKLRNDALHADWAKLDRAVIGSCIAFVEGLLVKHFG